MKWRTNGDICLAIVTKEVPHCKCGSEVGTRSIDKARKASGCQSLCSYSIEIAYGLIERYDPHHSCVQPNKDTGVEPFCWSGDDQLISTVPANISSRQSGAETVAHSTDAR